MNREKMQIHHVVVKLNSYEYDLLRNLHSQAVWRGSLHAGTGPASLVAEALRHILGFTRAPRNPLIEWATRK